MEASAAAKPDITPKDAALEEPTVRHPTALHIPPERNKARSAQGFPWRVVGYRIVLLMAHGEERQSAGGIILPDVRGSEGKSKELTVGVCVAHGAGEPVPYVGYLSPEHDYGCTVSDVVFIEPNTGIVIMDDDNEYRVITPHDIVMVARRDTGFETRSRMIERAGAAMKRYQANPSVLHGRAPNPHRLPDKPAYEEDIGSAKERLRKAAGKATKVQVSMSGAHKDRRK